MSFQQQVIQSLVWRGLYFVTVLVMNICMSRYFEADNAGWIFYLCNNLSLLLIVGGLTMEASVNYYRAKGEIAGHKLVWFSVLWSLMVTGVLTGALRLFLPYFDVGQTGLPGDYLFYSACYIAGIQLTSLFTVLFYSEKNFFLPNLLMVLLNLAMIAVIPKQQGVQGTNVGLITNLYFGYFLATGIVLAAAYIVKSKSWRLPGLPAAPEYRLLLRYALLALSANLIFFLVYRIDYWFVEKYCSAEALGNYIQVSKLSQMLLIIPTIIASVLFPHTARGEEREGIKDNILRIGRITSILFVLLFALMIVTGSWLFPWLFGRTYDMMYIPFLLLLPGIWALSNLYILSAYFGGINRVSVNIRGAGIALLFITVADIALIPGFGIEAAAIVSSAGYLINFLYSFYHMRKEHPVRLREYFGLNKADMQWIRSFLNH